MKVLTLTQPWASLVALGAKRIETRSWSTSYRGPLAIHAAAGLGPVGGKHGLIELIATEPFWGVLREALNQAKAWYGLKENIADAIEIPSASKPKYRLLNQHEAQLFLNAMQATGSKPSFGRRS